MPTPKKLRNHSPRPEGFGKLETKPNTVSVKQHNGKPFFEADNIILATGKPPRKIDSLLIDEKNCPSPRRSAQPKTPGKPSLVIVARGVIGCEYVAIFAPLLARTCVHLMDVERILPYEDATKDVARSYRQQSSHGVAVYTAGLELKRLWVENDRVKNLRIVPTSHCEIHEAERALVSIGRAEHR